MISYKYIYTFLVECGAINISDILNSHMYLIFKNNMK